MSVSRPLLIYDGDCGVCRNWVDYWHALTGAKVEYRPYQDAAADHPQIPLEAFRQAIQLVEPDGRLHTGAAATFRVLSFAPGRGWWWRLYLYLPGFAPITESAYAFFAHRRGLLNRLTRLLWGPALEPAGYILTSWLFLRLLGLIYASAFASLGVQILGLVGSEGILPLEPYLREVHRQIGGKAYLELPTLFWLNASDTALLAGTIVGVTLGLLVTLGIAVRAALSALFVLYLSYTYAGQVFMTYQWDLLLLEAGFLAIFLTGRSRIVVWLYRWLAFRFLFMAGAVKLLSGDAAWHELSALDYHFATQPLPSPLAWYAAHLPHSLLAAGTAAALVIELIVVFLVFAPRRLRAAAAWVIIAFQASIMLTGNFNFFNLLTMLLCLFLFDDAALRRVLPRRVVERVSEKNRAAGRSASLAAGVLALIVVPIGVNHLWRMHAAVDLPNLGPLTQSIGPLLIVNPYGLFANMTTERPEIVIEGSADGRTWHEYAFRYKPGAVARRPSWNIPHQPRLDWQMWFAALEPAPPHWFGAFMQRLLEGSPAVVALLAAGPFPEQPPKYLRAMLYEYRYADRGTRARTGQWWERRLAGHYFPLVQLQDFERSRER